MELDPLMSTSPEDDKSHAQNCVVLPPLFNRRHRKKLYACSLLFLAAAAAATVVFALWPSNPHVKIARLMLLHVRVHTHPRIAVDISLAAKVRVHNTDFYSIDYAHLDVAVGYRGRVLGHVTSGGGHVRARGSSYVDARVDLYEADVISDWIYLLVDFAKGSIQVDTLTQIDGFIGLFLFKIPLKSTLCAMREAYANTYNAYTSQAKAVQVKGFVVNDHDAISAFLGVCPVSQTIEVRLHESFGSAFMSCASDLRT